MIRVLVVLLIAAIGLSCALAVDRMRIQLNAANAVIEQREGTIKTLDAALASERSWSASREHTISAMIKISEDINTMRSTIRDQGRVSQKAFEELLKNDAQVRDYLAMPVPEPLGLLYKRSRTTDPTNYGPSGTVPTDSVRVPGKGQPEVKR